MAARRRQRRAHQLKPSVRCTPSLFDKTGHLAKIEYFCKYLAPRRNEGGNEGRDGGDTAKPRESTAVTNTSDEW
ncbi:hypothetical protein R3P38DRAFT_3222764 [Favolaschia claudopus]|uniref:Uncharacterized protein n=1 Tax=Favolaschia claudopus TaxID=2862362 RepID=A0AAV9ZY64_9AGAR